jgi:hypothetical protein
MRMKNGSSPGNLKLLIAQRLLELGWADRVKKFSACERRKLFFFIKNSSFEPSECPDCSCFMGKSLLRGQKDVLLC